MSLSFGFVVLNKILFSNVFKITGVTNDFIVSNRYKLTIDILLVHANKNEDIIAIKTQMFKIEVRLGAFFLPN